MTKLSYRSELYDYVISSHVLKHIVDDVKTIKEIYRVLKPGGTAIICVPMNIYADVTDEITGLSGEERIYRYGQSDHYRLYGLDFVERLASQGFKVVEYRPETEIENVESDTLQLLRTDFIYFATK